MRRLADQRGVSLPELVIVSAIFMIVLFSTRPVAGAFSRVNETTLSREAQIDRARRGMERGMRQLRNLARRINAPVIARATRSDFIFQTSDPERTWMRYCLENHADGDVWLWALATPAAVSSGMSGPCPGTGWTISNVVAQNIANTTPNRDFPLFSYGCVAGAPAGCPSTVGDLNRITSVTMDLWIDEDFDRAPPAARLTSAVFLRNQNEPPVASFSWKPVAPRQVLLNASASLDPEGRTMRFMWFKAPAPAFTCDQTPPLTQLLWQGVTLTHTFLPADGASGTQRAMELVVCDPGDLQSRQTQMVTIP